MATANAAHGVDVKFFDLDDSTALSAEATTDLGGNVYQITDTAKRILDPTATFTVSVGTITAIDYFEGKITTDSASTPTVSGAFVAEKVELSSNVMSAAIALSRTVLDDTPLNLTPGDGNRRKQLGLQDVDLTFGFHADSDNREEWFDALEIIPQLRVLAQVDLLDAGDVFRAWMAMSNQDVTAPIDDLVSFTNALVFHPQVSAQPALSGDAHVGLAFGS